MTYLPDVNVWLALAYSRHIHHVHARGWLDEVITDSVVFCRITELGLLRLLTNRSVMGEDVRSHREAWQVYDDLRADQRIHFNSETARFSAWWRSLGEGISGNHHAWTDAYLAAFASHLGASLVTFDQRLPALGGCAVLRLPS
jgi:toxin-antitoxin system PIN domain toxin